MAETANKTENTEKSEFTITRTFDVPRDLMWKVWTQVDHLQHWFGPRDAKTKVANMDFRPGGTYHYCMEFNGIEMWGKWTFQEIVEPERLTLLTAFSDKDGGITRHPLNAEWPREMHSVFLFEENEPGKTTVTVRWSPHDATEKEIEAFNAALPSMNQGWGGTMERLTEYLAGMKG